MNIVRRFANNRPCCRLFHMSSASFNFPQTTEENEAKKVILDQLNRKVKLPKAKEWSKTAVLEALASTVGTEVTPGYQELHSPEFWHYGRQPVEQKHNLRKSGRAAANYVIDNYNHLFQHDFEAHDIKPWIDTAGDEHFSTLSSPDAARRSDNTMKNEDASTESVENKETDEEGLALESEIENEKEEENVTLESSVESFQKLLDLKKIDQAADVFHQLHDDKVDIPQELLMQFLGLLSFYKGSDELRESIDEVPFRAYSFRSVDEKDESMDVVTKVFDRLPWENNPDLLQAHILALGNKNYEQHYTSAFQTRQRALKVISLFESLIEGKVKVSTHVYNEILLCAICLQYRERYKPAKRVIDEMDRQNVVPNYYTFCLFLRVLPHSNMSASALLGRFSSLLSDMNSFGIECGPDILSAMVTVTGRHIHHDKKVVLDAIFNFMTGKNLRYQHPMDVMAFTTMLRVYSQDLDHVKKLMDIAQYGNNSMVIARSPTAANKFYNTFFDILKEKDTIENVFYYYRTLLPARTFSTIKGRQSFIRYIRAKKRPEYLPIMYAGFVTSVSHVSNVRDLLFAALSLLQYADEDTKTQLKHIAMIEIKFCTWFIRESDWDKIMRLSFELVLLLSEDLPDVMTCFNRFLSLRTLPELNDKLLARLEDMGRQHRSSAVLSALEQFRKKSKKSVRLSKKTLTISESEQSTVERLDGLPLDKIEG